MKSGVWLAGIAALALPLSQAGAAALSNIRIARHADHVRIVLDLDAAISYSAAGGAFTLAGLEAESAVMNAAPADAPLKRVIIAPANGGARLSFETSAPVTPRAFTLTPDSDGGHRLVVDLYPARGAASDSEARRGEAPRADASSSPAAAAPAVGAAAEHSPTGTSAALPAASPVSHSADTAANSPAVPGMPIAPAIDAPGLPAPARPASRGPGYSPETLRAERALDRGDSKEACALAETALQANGTDLRALVVLGGCRLAQQDGAAAKAAYSSALAQDASFDRARVGLATALDMMGDQSGARAELSKVLGHGVPPEELARLVDAFKTLKPPQDAAAAPSAAAAPQRIVNNRSSAAVRGPSD